MKKAGDTAIPVLVFGTTVTALGAARAFARAGHEVWTHSEPGDVVTHSKYYRPVPLPPGFDAKASTDAETRVNTAVPADTQGLSPAVHGLLDGGRDGAAAGSQGALSGVSFAARLHPHARRQRPSGDDHG